MRRSCRSLFPYHQRAKAASHNYSARRQDAPKEQPVGDHTHESEHLSNRDPPLSKRFLAQHSPSNDACEADNGNHENVLATVREQHFADEPTELAKSKIHLDYPTPRSSGELRSSDHRAAWHCDQWPVAQADF